MQSAFGRQRSASATSSPNIDEFYGFRGLNLTDPDEEMSPGDSPWTINSRMYARNDGESRVANRTRKGASHLSTPAGSTADVQNVATSTGDLDFSTIKVIANPMTFTATNALTRLDTEIKKIGQATGHVIVEIYTDNSGVPGTLIAESSILGSNITTTYQYLTSYFIDAPTVVNGTQYWAVYYIQDNGSGSYYLNQTAAGSALELFSTDAGQAWSSINCGIHYKTYLATPGTVKGFNVRYPSNGTNLILMAHQTSLYSIPKATGVLTAVDTGRSASASKYRFEQVDDYTVYANDFDRLRRWNGVDAPQDVPGVPTIDPANVMAWQNRVFIYKGTRVEFSELGDMTSWPSVNFFYIPITTPKSPDHIAGWKIFQDNMVFWTHLTKYQVIGSNISNFTYKEVVGTKGACSQEAIVTDRNYAYFMADDKQIYRWNGGGDDVLLSQSVEGELQGLDDINAVRLHLYRNQLRVYYTKGGEGRMLLLDIEMSVPTQQDWRWFLDTGHPVCGSANMFLDKDDPLIEFSNKVGRVYFGETQYNDLGKALDWKYWTPYKTYGYRRRNGQSFGGASTKKRIKRFRPIIRVEDADYTMSVGKDMDFANKPDMRAYVVSGGGAKFGAFKWGDGTKWGRKKQVMTQSGMSGRGNFIQYRFERKGVNTPVELYGYIAQYKIGKPK